MTIEKPSAWLLGTFHVTIPVAAGRNLAVLVEAAVRNFVLNQRGIDSTKEFIERQQRLMEDGE